MILRTQIPLFEEGGEFLFLLEVGEGVVKIVDEGFVFAFGGDEVEAVGSEGGGGDFEAVCEEVGDVGGGRDLGQERGFDFAIGEGGEEGGGCGVETGELVGREEGGGGEEADEGVRKVGEGGVGGVEGDDEDEAEVEEVLGKVVLGFVVDVGGKGGEDGVKAGGVVEGGWVGVDAFKGEVVNLGNLLEEVLDKAVDEGGLETKVEGIPGGVNADANGWLAGGAAAG